MISKRPQIDLTEEDIEFLFTYHAPRSDQLPAFEAINLASQQFARAMAANVPPGPDRTVAVRTLQALRMECNLAIALAPPPHEPEEEPEPDINS